MDFDGFLMHCDGFCMIFDGFLEDCSFILDDF